MGKLKIMDFTGHTTLDYEQDTKEAEEAKSTFDKKIAAGYNPFVRNEETGQYEQVSVSQGKHRSAAFNVQSEYLLAPPVAGG